MLLLCTCIEASLHVIRLDCAGGDTVVQLALQLTHGEWVPLGFAVCTFFHFKLVGFAVEAQPGRVMHSLALPLLIKPEVQS